MVTSLIAALLVGVSAQSGDRLYDGARSVKSQQISLQPWGNGRIAETKERAFQGAQSVRVSSENYFQGGTLNFSSAKDLADKFDDPNNSLRVTFILGDALPVTGKTDRSTTDGSLNMNPKATGNAVSFNPGNPGDLKIRPSIPFKPTIKKVRMIVATTDGKKSEIYVPVHSTVGVGDGWRSMSVPLHAIVGLDRTNKTLHSITLCTDTISTLYVGDVAVTRDTTPIDGKIDRAPLTVKLGKELTLRAAGDAGNTPLVFSWDFDDSDGIQSEAEGWQVTRLFRKPGEFNVTLTISDYYGVKASLRRTLKVKVAS